MTPELELIMSPKYPVTQKFFEDIICDAKRQSKAGFYGKLISNAFAVDGKVVPTHVGSRMVIFDLFTPDGQGRAVVSYKSGIGPSGVTGTDVLDGVNPGPIGPLESDLEPHFYVYVRNPKDAQIWGYCTSDPDAVKSILTGKSA